MKTRPKMAAKPFRPFSRFIHLNLVSLLCATQLCGAVQAQTLLEQAHSQHNAQWRDKQPAAECSFDKLNQSSVLRTQQGFEHRSIYDSGHNSGQNSGQTQSLPSLPKTSLATLHTQSTLKEDVQEDLACQTVSQEEQEAEESSGIAQQSQQDLQEDSAQELFLQQAKDLRKTSKESEDQLQIEPKYDAPITELEAILAQDQKFAAAMHRINDVRLKAFAYANQKLKDFIAQWQSSKEEDRKQFEQQCQEILGGQYPWEMSGYVSHIVPDWINLNRPGNKDQTFVTEGLYPWRGNYREAEEKGWADTLLDFYYTEYLQDAKRCGSYWQDIKEVQTILQREGEIVKEWQKKQGIKISDEEPEGYMARLLKQAGYYFATPYPYEDELKQEAQENSLLSLDSPHEELSFEAKQEAALAQAAQLADTLEQIVADCPAQPDLSEIITSVQDSSKAINAVRNAPSKQSSQHPSKPRAPYTANEAQNSHTEIHTAAKVRLQQENPDRPESAELVAARALLAVSQDEFAVAWQQLQEVAITSGCTAEELLSLIQDEKLWDAPDILDASSIQSLVEEYFTAAEGDRSEFELAQGQYVQSLLQNKISAALELQTEGSLQWLQELWQQAQSDEAIHNLLEHMQVQVEVAIKVAEQESPKDKQTSPPASVQWTSLLTHLDSLFSEGGVVATAPSSKTALGLQHREFKTDQDWSATQEQQITDLAKGLKSDLQKASTAVDLCPESMPSFEEWLQQDDVQQGLQDVGLDAQHLELDQLSVQGVQTLLEIYEQDCRNVLQNSADVLNSYVREQEREITAQAYLREQGVVSIINRLCTRNQKLLDFYIQKQGESQEELHSKLQDWIDGHNTGNREKQEPFEELCLEIYGSLPWEQDETLGAYSFVQHMQDYICYKDKNCGWYFFYNRQGEVVRKGVWPLRAAKKRAEARLGDGLIVLEEAQRRETQRLDKLLATVQAEKQKTLEAYWQSLSSKLEPAYSDAKGPHIDTEQVHTLLQRMSYAQSRSDEIQELHPELVAQESQAKQSQEEQSRQSLDGSHSDAQQDSDNPSQDSQDDSEQKSESTPDNVSNSAETTERTENHESTEDKKSAQDPEAEIHYSCQVLEDGTQLFFQDWQDPQSKPQSHDPDSSDCAKHSEDDNSSASQHRVLHHMILPEGQRIDVLYSVDQATQQLNGTWLKSETGLYLYSPTGELLSETRKRSDGYQEIYSQGLLIALANPQGEMVLRYEYADAASESASELADQSTPANKELVGIIYVGKRQEINETYFTTQDALKQEQAKQMAKVRDNAQAALDALRHKAKLIREELQADEATLLAKRCQELKKQDQILQAHLDYFASIEKRGDQDISGYSAEQLEELWQHLSEAQENVRAELAKLSDADSQEAQEWLQAKKKNNTVLLQELEASLPQQEQELLASQDQILSQMQQEFSAVLEQLQAEHTHALAELTELEARQTLNTLTTQILGREASEAEMQEILTQIAPEAQQLDTALLTGYAQHLRDSEEYQQDKQFIQDVIETLDQLVTTQLIPERLSSEEWEQIKLYLNCQGLHWARSAYLPLLDILLTSYQGIAQNTDQGSLDEHNSGQHTAQGLSLDALYEQLSLLATDVSAKMGIASASSTASRAQEDGQALQSQKQKALQKSLLIQLIYNEITAGLLTTETRGELKISAYSLSTVGNSYLAEMPLQLNPKQDQAHKQALKEDADADQNVMLRGYRCTVSELCQQYGIEDISLDSDEASQAENVLEETSEDMKQEHTETALDNTDSSNWTEITPCIAHLKADHYIEITAISATGVRYVDYAAGQRFHCPSSDLHAGRMQQMSLTEFNAEFSGVILTTEDFSSNLDLKPGSQDLAGKEEAAESSVSWTQPLQAAELKEVKGAGLFKKIKKFFHKVGEVVKKVVKAVVNVVKNIIEIPKRIIDNIKEGKWEKVLLDVGAIAISFVSIGGVSVGSLVSATVGEGIKWLGTGIGSALSWTGQLIGGSNAVGSFLSTVGEGLISSATLISQSLGTLTGPEGVLVYHPEISEGILADSLTQTGWRQTAHRCTTALWDYASENMLSAGVQAGLNELGLGEAGQVISALLLDFVDPNPYQSLDSLTSQYLHTATEITEWSTLKLADSLGFSEKDAAAIQLGAEALFDSAHLHETITAVSPTVLKTMMRNEAQGLDWDTNIEESLTDLLNSHYAGKNAPILGDRIQRDIENLFGRTEIDQALTQLLNDLPTTDTQDFLRQLDASMSGYDTLPMAMRSSFQNKQFTTSLYFSMMQQSYGRNNIILGGNQVTHDDLLTMQSILRTAIPQVNITPEQVQDMVTLLAKAQKQLDDNNMNLNDLITLGTGLKNDLMSNTLRSKKMQEQLEKFKNTNIAVDAEGEFLDRYMLQDRDKNMKKAFGKHLEKNNIEEPQYISVQINIEEKSCVIHTLDNVDVKITYVSGYRQDNSDPKSSSNATVIIHPDQATMDFEVETVKHQDGSFNPKDNLYHSEQTGEVKLDYHNGQGTKTYTKGSKTDGVASESNAIQTVSGIGQSDKDKANSFMESEIAGTVKLNEGKMTMFGSVSMTVPVDMSDSEEPNKSRVPEKSITVNYSYDDILKNPELLNLDQIFS